LADDVSYSCPDSFFGINIYLKIKLLNEFSADVKVSFFFTLYMIIQIICLLRQMMYEEASQVANDTVGSIRTVASFCRIMKMFQMYG